MLFYQRPLLNAFLYGRLVKKNLCYDTVYNDELLNKTVGELRKEILPEASAKNSGKDYWMFVCWCFLSVAYHGAVFSIFIYYALKLITFFF
jgi:hypothetical protein